MKKLIWPVSITTFIAIFYVLSVALQLSYALVVGLFIAVPLFTIWMVIRILKDGVHSGKTFDDHFYEFK